MQRNKFLNKTLPFRAKISLVIFGLFLAVVLLEIGLRLGGFFILSAQEYRNRQSIRQKGIYRIMCLGESTTQNQYPFFIGAILNQRQIGIQFGVIDKGIAGADTRVILNQLESNLKEYNPDMVVVMMGVNDRGPHIPYEAATASKITIFLRSFRTYKMARLLWLHIITKANETKVSRFPITKLKEIPVVPISSESAFNKAIELNPKNDQVYLGLGWYYRYQGKSSLAEEVLKKAIALNPKNDQAYVGLGWRYYDQGEFSLAESAFKKTIELNPNNEEAYLGLGWCYRAQGEFSLAESAFNKAIELNPKNDQAYVGLGWRYYDQGEFSLAEGAFKKAIELNPKNDQAYVGLGWRYRHQGNSSLAESAFNKAIELNPKNDQAYLGLGWCYRAQGEFSLTESALKKAIELNPKNEEAYLGLGWYYRYQGKSSLAEEVLKKAIELNPKNDQVYIRLGWRYYDQGKPSLTESDLKKAIELNPKNDQAYLGLGWCYRAQGKFSLAESAFKKAIELNPKNDQAYIRLGWRYYDQGKPSLTESAFKKAIELNPKNDQAYVGLGWCYRDQGKSSLAESAFKKAIELRSGENVVAYGMRSVLYEEIGRPDMAREYARKANSLRLEYCNAATAYNYRKLKRILDKRGVRLVVVQYPMRSIEPLKKIFKDDAEGVIFVGNEKVFRDAVRKEGFNAYFIDMFAGDFGHCTDKGNRLLAENIAKTILREVFHK